MVVVKINIKCAVFGFFIFAIFTEYIFNSYFEIKDRSLKESKLKSLDDLNSNIKDIPPNSMLFIHIPKSSGTSFTNILRRIQCHTDKTSHIDCCHNPGSCHFKMKRRCKSIIGCVSHYPRSNLVSHVNISIAMFREPVSRAISGWFYPGHNPNSDAFHVVKPATRRISFAEYLQMREYQNIQTRMLGANSFPYRNIPVTSKVYTNAVNVLNQLFFIGLKEEFEVSALILMKMMNISTQVININQIPIERISNDSHFKENKEYIQQDLKTMTLLKQFNHYDIELYKLAIKRFCIQVRKYPELLIKLTLIKC